MLFLNPAYFVAFLFPFRILVLFGELSISIPVPIQAMTSGRELNLGLIL